MATPISIAVTRVDVEKDSDELWSDELYVVSCVVDLSNQITLPGQTITIPQVGTTITGIWTSADTGDALKTMPILTLPNPLEGWFPAVWRKPCWNFEMQPQLVNNPKRLIIIVAMMEHDDTSTNVVRNLVTSQVTAQAFAQASSSISQNVFVDHLRETMDAAIETANSTTPLNSDEQIGKSQELPLTPTDLEQLDKPGKQKLFKRLTFKGNGGEYTVRFEFRNYSFIGEM